MDERSMLDGELAAGADGAPVESGDLSGSEGLSGAAEGEDTRAVRLVLILWFLFLFEPMRLIGTLIPPLRPLQWIPELLLYGTLLMWLLSHAPKRQITWFTAFFGLTLVGTVVAFFLGNWGVARIIDRQFIQYYGLGVLTLSYCDSPKRADTVLRMYFLAFLYYGIWGLLSLKLSPISDTMDPGAREIVWWHIFYSNRDGFGPLMVLGFGFSIYYYRVAIGRRMKTLVAGTIVLCILGILISFGRGVFLAFIATMCFIWIKTRRKIVTGIALAAMLFAIVLSFPQFTDRYLATMKTIFSEGTASGTGLDRRILWGWAWREFVSSPIIGVGTGNFGIAVFRVVTPGEMLAKGYTAGALWRRVIHCAPMTVLSEYGLVGIIIFVGVLAEFARTNRRTLRDAQLLAYAGEREDIEELTFRPSSVVALSNGLNVAFVALLISLFFYELLYTPLLWHLVVINRLVYLASRRAWWGAEPRSA